MKSIKECMADAAGGASFATPMNTMGMGGVSTDTMAISGEAPEKHKPMSLKQKLKLALRKRRKQRKQQ